MTNLIHAELLMGPARAIGCNHLTESIFIGIGIEREAMPVETFHFDTDGDTDFDPDEKISSRTAGL